MALEVSPTFSILPGLPYVIGIIASSDFDSVAVIDPVLEPHPDNPDIIIEFPNAVADPNRPPLMAGLTPEALLGSCGLVFPVRIRSTSPPGTMGA